MGIINIHILEPSWFGLGCRSRNKENERTLIDFDFLILTMLMRGKRKTHLNRISLNRISFHRGAQARNVIQRHCFLFREGPVKRRRYCCRGTMVQCLLSSPVVFLFLCPAASSPSHSLQSRVLGSAKDGGRRADKSPVDESEIEIFLDHEGRVPGGILPDSPKPANLKYGFRSFRNYLNFTSLKVCSRGTLISSLAVKHPESVP